MSKTTVDIRPTVSYLSILPSINYRAWYALAEFVDNSIQSYINNKRILKKNNPKHKLKISIYVSKNKIRILDNAYPIGDVFGVDIYEAIHMKTNQKVYVTINEIYK